MAYFVPHKTLIEAMWYGGMSIPEIDGVLVYNRYNSLPPDVYGEIIEDVSIRPWKDAHEINQEIYAFNSTQRYTLKLKLPYFRTHDFSSYYNWGSVYDIMTYFIGSKRGNSGQGTTKAMKIFNTGRLRQFVEIATIAGLSAESIRHCLATLEPNYGMWAIKPILTYTKMFWDATRLTMRENNVRLCDIRAYLDLGEDNRFYEPYLAHLDASEDDVLAHFGLADYSTIQRKNKSLHGKIGSQIMDYFDNKTRKIIPSDYIKLYVHLDTQIQELESQDQGMEAYRTEMKRIFDRVEYIKDNYKTMDEINEKFIAIDPTIETDEPYIKDERE